MPARRIAELEEENISIRNQLCDAWEEIGALKAQLERAVKGYGKEV